MPKSLLLFFVFLILMMTSPSFVKADFVPANGLNRYKDNKFLLNFFIPGITDTDKSQRLVENSPIQVSIKAIDPDDPGKFSTTFAFEDFDYFYRLTNPEGQSCVPSDTYVDAAVKNSSGRLSKGTQADIWGEVFLPNYNYVRACPTATYGRWTMDVWITNPMPKPEDYIIKGAEFFVNYVTEGPASISYINDNPVNKTICTNPGKITQVLLNRGKKNTRYSFWWETAGFLWEWGKNGIFAAEDVTVPNDNTAEAVKLTGNGLPTPLPNAGTVKLCMGEDMNIATILAGAQLDNWCNKPGHSIDFKYQENLNECAVSTTPFCTHSVITATSGKAEYRVEVYGTNFPAESIRSFLTPTSGTILETSPQAPNPAGGIVFNFGNAVNPVPTGIYTFTARKATYTPGESALCSISNIIITSQVASPPPASAPPIKKECDPNDKANYNKAKCTLGGGDPCGDANNPGFKTAIGCIHTKPDALVKDVLTFAVAISGGLAFLMMLLGAYQMLASQGNPETLTAGKDRLTNAIIGLLFVIFSVLLMQIIGFDILKIPGFGR